MNTQKVIYEKLAKQNFGAIEDAIGEAQATIDAQLSNMESALYSLNTETEQIVSGIQGFASQAKQMIDNAKYSYDEAETEYLRIANTLDEYGIVYNGLDNSVSSDFKDAINYANTIANLDL